MGTAAGAGSRWRWGREGAGASSSSSRGTMRMTAHIYNAMMASLTKTAGLAEVCVCVRVFVCVCACRCCVHMEAVCVCVCVCVEAVCGEAGAGEPGCLGMPGGRDHELCGVIQQRAHNQVCCHTSINQITTNVQHVHQSNHNQVCCHTSITATQLRGRYHKVQGLRPALVELAHDAHNQVWLHPLSTSICWDADTPPQHRNIY